MIASDRERISCLEEAVLLQRVAIKALVIRLQIIERALPDQIAQENARAKRVKTKKV